MQNTPLPSETPNGSRSGSQPSRSPWSRLSHLSGQAARAVTLSARGIFRLRRWSLFIFLSALVLRLAGIGLDALWYDESFTLHIARLPLPQMMQAVLGDVHPPLYYLIVWAVGHLAGFNETTLRLPSAVFSAACSVEVFKLVKSVIGDREARTASIIMAIAPAFVSYGQEGRSYALLALLILVTLRAVIDGKWARAGLAAAAVMYTHNLGALYLPFVGLLALARSPRQAIKTFSGSLALYLPWLPSALYQLQTLSQGFWIAPQTIGALPYAALFTTLYVRWPQWAAIHIIMFTTGMTIFSLWTLRSSWRKLLPLLGLAGAPPVVMLLISWLWRPIFLERGLLPSGAALLSLWGIALARWQGPNRRAALAICGPLFVAGLVAFYVMPGEFNWRQFGQIIDQNWQPGDFVYHMNVTSWIETDTYLDHTSYLYPESNDLSQNLSDQTKDALGIERVPFDDLARTHERVWFLWVNGPLISAREYYFASDVLGRYRTIRRWDLYDLATSHFRLYLLDLKETETARPSPALQRGARARSM